MANDRFEDGKLHVFADVELHPDGSFVLDGVSIVGPHGHIFINAPDVPSLFTKMEGVMQHVNQKFFDKPA